MEGLAFIVQDIVVRYEVRNQPILEHMFGVIYEGSIIKAFETEEEAYEWIEASGSIAPYCDIC